MVLLFLLFIAFILLNKVPILGEMLLIAIIVVGICLILIVGNEYFEIQREREQKVLLENVK